jgi:PAS domain S-box-containing protein
VNYNAIRMDINDMCSDRMCFRMDKVGACISINDAFLKFFGYSEHDIMDYSFENVIHEEDVPEMRLKWARAIEKKSRFSDEQRIVDVNGGVHHCLVRAYPIMDGENLMEFTGTIDLMQPINN